MKFQSDFEALLNNKIYQLLKIRDHIGYIFSISKNDDYSNITKINSNAINFMVSMGIATSNNGYELTEYGMFIYCELFR